MREKLIELLWQWGVQQYIPFHTEIAMLADYLIANGVTVSDTNVGKWIPVTDERKPKQLQECLCVCAFEDDLNWRWQCVLKWHGIPYQNNGFVNRPHFTDEGVNGMVVTHWMPLPEPPTQ